MTTRIRHLAIVVAIAAAASRLFWPEAVRAASDVEELRRQELDSLRRNIDRAARREKALAEERKALAREAEAVSARLVELAGRVQAREALISRNERRIRELKEKESSLLALLAMNRGAIAELLAALQKLRRDPPPPFVTRPDDVLGAVRSALLLSATIPQVDAKMEALLRSIARLRQVREGLRRTQEEKRRNLEELRRTRAEVNALLADKRRLLRRVGEKLEEEKRRLKRLTDRARTLNDVMMALRREEKRRREAAARRRKETHPASDGRRMAEGEGAETPRRKPAQRAPSVPRRPFVTLKGRLPWPVQGRKVLGYGERLGLGGRSRGIYVATRPRAYVVAPADARVELARPFRSYGQLLILDPGGGYRILLAGLDRTTVETGQTIRAGEPVGEMGTVPAPATVADGRLESRQPILYMELRKNGRPVDASRWWLGARQEAHRK